MIYTKDANRNETTGIAIITRKVWRIRTESLNSDAQPFLSILRKRTIESHLI